MKTLSSEMNVDRLGGMGREFGWSECAVLYICLTEKEQIDRLRYGWMGVSVVCREAEKQKYRVPGFNVWYKQPLS